MGIARLRRLIMHDPGFTRDVLPLPTGAGLDLHLHGASHCALSAAGAKKGRQLRRQEVWLKEGIRTLNELGGRGAAARERAALSLPQQLAVRHLARAYGAMSSPPDGHDPLVAWRTLQGSRSGYSDTSEEVLGVAAGRLAP